MIEPKTTSMGPPRKWVDVKVEDEPKSGPMVKRKDQLVEEDLQLRPEMTQILVEEIQGGSSIYGKLVPFEISTC